MTLEHLCSRKCGGSNAAANLRISCAKCNNERTDACASDCTGRWGRFPSDRMWVGRGSGSHPESTTRATASASAPS